MVKIITGGKRLLNPPCTTVGTCALDEHGEVISIHTDYVEYHGGQPTDSMYFIGQDLEHNDLFATCVMGTSDITTIIGCAPVHIDAISATIEYVGEPGDVPIEEPKEQMR